MKIFEYVCVLKIDTNEYPNIFESKSCHKRISEYICIQKVDMSEYPNIFVSKNETNQYPNKYLDPKYLNIWIFKYIRHTLHLTFDIWYLTFVIWYLIFDTCHLTFTNSHLIFENWQLKFYNWHLTFDNEITWYDTQKLYWHIVGGHIAFSRNIPINSTCNVPTDRNWGEMFKVDIACSVYNATFVFLLPKPMFEMFSTFLLIPGLQLAGFSFLLEGLVGSPLRHLL